MSRLTAAQEHFFTPGLPGIVLPDCICGAASSGMGGSHYGSCPRYCSRCAYLTDCGPTHAEMNELFYGRGARAYSRSGHKNNVEKACDHLRQIYVWNVTRANSQWRCKDCGELV